MGATERQLEVLLRKEQGLQVGRDRRGLWVTTALHHRRTGEICYLRPDGAGVKLEFRTLPRERIARGMQSEFVFAAILFWVLLTGISLLFAKTGRASWGGALGLIAGGGAFVGTLVRLNANSQMSADAVVASRSELERQILDLVDLAGDEPEDGEADRPPDGGPF